MCQVGDDFYAFGPVVKELEELSCFKTIVWIGFDNSKKGVNKSLIKLNKENVKLILLPSSGGKNIISKLYILLLYPIYFFKILKELFKSKYIHVRTPSNPAVITMFLSVLIPSKNFWFKYAGDWIGDASRFYRFQRKLLINLGKNSKITINGNWENQSENVIGFENPCLDETDRELGKIICENKQVVDKINYCYVGGMNANKGVDKIIDVLAQLTKLDNFGVFHFVGGGELLKSLKKKSESFSDKVVFHGFLAKQDIYKVYEKCHFIVLPSKSEGFPKVIGEAMNYGCVPIVSNISCIGQYINHNKNGLLIQPITTQELSKNLKVSLTMQKLKYREMVLYNYNLAGKFTYSYYEHRIVNDIFN
jgi:glycosyltransferase involved in cell wall biosynthesis